jgi:hypothetical protein
MDARTIRLRLSGHGDVTAHKDGSFTLSLRRPAGEFWRNRMGRAVRDEIPGAVLRLYRCRPAADRYFEFHEVFFRLGPACVTEIRDARERACTAAREQATPLAAATSADSTDGEGTRIDVGAPACREDATAGRDRHFAPPPGTRPEFIHSVTAQHLDTEGPNHEVAIAERDVVPARTCDSPGKRPGSDGGPGRVSPGEVVGREQGRAA